MAVTIEDVARIFGSSVDEKRLAYRQQILSAVFDTRSRVEIQNDSVDDAADLLTGAFVGTNGFAYIVSQNLKREAYERPYLIDQAVDFTLRGNDVRLLVQNDLDWDDIQDNKFVEALACKGDVRRFDIMHIAPPQGALEHNFAVTDRFVRFEPNHGQPNALGIVNDHAACAQFKDEFDGLWAHAKPIRNRPTSPAVARLKREKIRGGWLYTADEIPELHVGLLDDTNDLSDIADAAGLLETMKTARYVEYVLRQSGGDFGYLQKV